MANITLTGTLLDPNSDLSVGDEIRFTHASTTGQTVKGAISLVTIGPAGTYSVLLQYGLVLVEYKDVRSTQFKSLGVATVNGSNPATTIPELLNALVPASSAELIEFQAILADAVAAQVAAEAAAADAAASVTSLAALAARTAGLKAVYLELSGRSGMFSWDSSDLSIQVTADTLQGIYVATSADATGASGAWVRALENGWATCEMFGSTGADDEDVTTVLNSGKILVSKMLITNKSITLASDVQLDGITVQGSNTIVKNKQLVGGKLISITSEEQYERVEPASNQSPPVTKNKTKLVIREATTPSGTPLDAYSIISPSAYGGIARFILATGIGGSGSGDLGAPWDRLRTVGSYLYTDGWAINNVITTQSGSVVPYTHKLELFLDVGTDKWTPDGTDTIVDFELNPADWVEFTVNGKISNKGNVAFYTSSGSSDNITILVNGVDVTPGNSKVISGAAAQSLRVLELTYDNAVGNIVRITNNHASAKTYLYGVNLYRVGSMPQFDAAEAGYVTSIILTGQRNVLYTGVGASIDHVIQDDNDKLGGSYHGGETALGTAVSLRVRAGAGFAKLEAATTINTSPTTMAIGEVICGNFIVALSVTEIVVNTGTLNSRTALDFGVDGGCNLTGVLNATADIALTRLYTGMHATDRSLNRYLTGTVVEASATNNSIPIKRSMLPFYQFSGDFTQCCISPQTFELGLAKKPSRIWDNVNYIKFYYQPLDNVSLTLESGEDLRFSCLYQYGANMI